MKVPEKKEVWIGNRLYKAGDELPADYQFPEKKKKQPFVKETKKINE